MTADNRYTLDTPLDLRPRRLAAALGLDRAGIDQLLDVYQHRPMGS